MPFRYQNRIEAGQKLAEALQAYQGTPKILLLALPRGGVPVAYEIARRLGAEVDLLIVRKLGFPGHEELAMGAIASGGVRVLNPELIWRVKEQDIEQIAAIELQELQRREQLYRGSRPLPTLQGRPVILVDDGLATGATMLAAIQAVRQGQPAEIVVAVPVAPPDTLEMLSQEADRVVCPYTPHTFASLSQWYVDFSQTSDEEVRELLRRSWEKPGEELQR